MANSMYAHGRENFILGNIDWDGDTIKVVLVDEGDDVPSIADDEDLADRAAPSRVATSGALANASCSGGVADTDDVTISTVSGDEFESLDIYKDSGTEGTSWLICNIDTATGLPCTPNGGDITIQWDSGANKIFAWNAS